jgi:hypothetical protein
VKSTQRRQLDVVNLVIGIFGFVMIVLPALIFKDSSASLTGLEASFGYEFVNLGTFATAEIGFNALVLSGYVLFVIAGVIPLVMKTGVLISTLSYIGAGLIMLMIPTLTISSVTVMGTVTEITLEWTYGIGLVLAVIVAIIGASGGLLRIAFNKT